MTVARARREAGFSIAILMLLTILTTYALLTALHTGQHLWLIPFHLLMLVFYFRAFLSLVSLVYLQGELGEMQRSSPTHFTVNISRSNGQSWANISYPLQDNDQWLEDQEDL